MSDFKTKTAVKTLLKAYDSLGKVWDEWDECETVNGDEDNIEAATNALSIISSARDVLIVAANMLEDIK